MTANRPPVPKEKPNDEEIIKKLVKKLSLEQCTQLLSGQFSTVLPENDPSASIAYQELMRRLTQAQQQNTTSSDNKVVEFIHSQLSTRIKEHEQVVKTISKPSVSFTLSVQLTLFSLLPNEVVNLLFISGLSGTDSFNLLRTSKNLFVLFKPTIWQLADHPLRKLLSHGALGELEQAEVIWKKDLSILTYYGTVYHPNRTYNDDVDPPVWTAIPEEMSFARPKYVNVTYLQILMMNEEWAEATAVAKHMDMKEVAKQSLEVFPDGKIVKYDNDGNEWDFAKAQQLLEELFAAIIEDMEINANDPSKMSKKTKTARDKFFAYHQPNPNGHSKGLVFDPRSVEAALKLFEDEYFKFANDAQRGFWNKRVEEASKSLSGTGFLRPCSQGLFKGKVERKGCFLADGSSYFAFCRPTNSLPGFHFWVTGYGRVGLAETAGRVLWAEGRRCDAGSFSKLMSSKYESRDRLYAAIFTCNKNIGVSEVEIALQ
jgi:hypothetical protein